MKNNSAKRIRRSKSQWNTLISKYESSGISRNEFCLMNGISPSSFAKAIARHKAVAEKPCSVDNHTNGFLPVEVMPSDEAISSRTKNIDSTIDISIGIATIHISAGFDPGLLKQLAGVLAELC